MRAVSLLPVLRVALIRNLNRNWNERIPDHPFPFPFQVGTWDAD